MKTQTVITQTVTATEANRSFSRLLAAVKRGERVEITSHGETVAVVSQPEADLVEKARRDAAYADLKRHLSSLKPVTVGRWTRDDLNARD